jgi:phage major head subunit gpT-like protein
MLLNRPNLNALFTGFQIAFNQGFAGAESVFEQVAMTIPSTTSQETYAWLGTVTRFREWLGDRVIQNLASHDFTLKNKPFESTIGVDRDNIEDDTYGVYTPMLQQLGQDAKTHPDELVMPLLKNGFNTVCFDGQYFFDTDHPVLDASGNPQSASNFGGGAGTPWYLLDTSRVIKPLIFQKRKDYKFVHMDQENDEAVFSRKQFRYGVDARVNAGYGLWQLAYGSKQTLDETNLSAAIAAMESQVGDNGKPLGVKATLLVVPPSLKVAAKKLVVAQTAANGATNVLAGEMKVLSSAFVN